MDFDKYRMLGVGAIGFYIFNFIYHILFIRLPDAFHLCYFTLIFLGIGLVMNNRLIFGIGAFFAVFPLIQVIFRIIGLLSYAPSPFTFRLALDISLHTFVILVTILGYKKFQYFHPDTWLVSSILAISIWFLTFFLIPRELNVNYTYTTPIFLEFMGLWGFFTFTSITLCLFWFLLNHYGRAKNETKSQKQKRN
ncbi:MAG: hypothetical protein ACFFD2_22140 [Promethearchaeota archaeon]